MRAYYIVLGLCLFVGPACGHAAEPTDQTMTLRYAGATRNFLIHFPNGYRSSRSIPLMISLHGGGSDAVEQKQISGFDALSEPNNFIVVYPNAAGSDWNLTNSTSGDVGFLTSIVNLLTSSGYPIDRTRMYLAGYSDGGYLAQLAMLCTPGQWAGIGVVASNFYPEMLKDCPVNPPLRTPATVIMFHGEADTLNPYSGGKDITGRPVDSAAQSFTEWVSLDNCLPSSITINITDQLNNKQQVFDTLQQPEACSGTTLVQLYSIPQAGHTWPGSGMPLTATTSDGISLGPTSMDLQASRLIWSLVKSHKTSSSR